MPRMRLVGWSVQPVIMADDGDNLDPVQVQPQMIPAKDWQAFKQGGDEASLEQMRAQIEGPPAVAGEPDPASVG
jgi:hypothetical protein